jgi:CRP/FNR family transcriptional regulator, cyclic AMP receptor protein
MSDRAHDATILSKVPLFASFGDADRAAVAARMQTRRYSKGSLLVRENEPGESLFIVLRGNVAVTRATSDGKESILSILKEGDFFGEMAVLDESPRSATIKALKETETAILSREDFLDLLRSNPHMSLLLVVALSARLRATNEAIQAAAFQDIPTRLAALLLYLSKNFGEATPGGTRLTLRLTNQEMASMIGTTRESVNRTLNRFWDDKLIDMHESHIIISNPQGLEALASKPHP